MMKALFDEIGHLSYLKQMCQFIFMHTRSLSILLANRNYKMLGRGLDMQLHYQSTIMTLT